MHLVGDESLALDVSFVLHLDFCRLGNLFFPVVWCFHRCLQVGDDFRQVLKVEIRTSHEVDELAAGAEWSSAECFELRIDLVFLDRMVGTEVDDSFDGIFLLHPPVVTVALGDAELVCFFRESGIGVVLTEQDAVLGS